MHTMAEAGGMSGGKKAALGCGLVSLAALAAAVLLAGLLLVGGASAGWWYYSGDEPEEVTVTADEEIIEDEVIEEEVADAGESWYNPDWWSPEYWGFGGGEPDDSTSDDGTVADGGDTDGDGTSDGTATPTPPTAAPVVVTGIKGHGVAFTAPGKSGAMTSVSAVVIGDVPNSARSSAGETEEIWLEGTHADPVSGIRRANVGNKVVELGDIRGKVGIKTKWTSIPGYTGVNGRCVVTHARDTDSPGSCEALRSTTRVASR